MAFRILVTDGHSAVGEAIRAVFENHHFALVCPEPGSVEWSDDEAVLRVLEQARPAVVINTLNWAHMELLTGQQSLVAACKKLDSTVIHLTRSEIFPQSSTLAIDEGDEFEADTDLGRVLAQVEAQFLEVQRCIALRLPWIMDLPGGHIDRTCSLLRSESKLNVCDQQKATPIFIDDLAKLVVAMVKQILCGAENWGVFHFHSSDACSEAEFADLISRTMKRELGEEQVASIVAVPHRAQIFESFGWLEGRRCTNDFGFQLQSWRKGVKSKVLGWLSEQMKQGSIFNNESSVG